MCKPAGNDDHAAALIDRGEVSLYDPGGSYTAVATDSGERKIRPPRGDVFSKDVYDIDLDDYIKFHTEHYPDARVSTYTFPTTSDQEREILRRAQENGETMGGFCAVAVSEVIKDVGPLAGIKGAFRPTVLGQQAKSALDELEEKEAPD